MSKIIGAMLVKNESDRWLKYVIEQMKLVCDKIIVLDDASTDDTVKICEDLGCQVWLSTESLWGANELHQRKRLWEYVTAQCNDGDWILCLDADEIMTNIEMLKDIINNIETSYKPGPNYKLIDGISLPLYDMWSNTHYRDDEYWTAHKRAWTMCVRYNADKEYSWNNKKLHCGRFPSNAAENVGHIELIKIKHMGWSTSKDRAEKYKRYLQADPYGENGILEQYKSILDENPNLKKFTDKKTNKILIAAPVHQDEDVFLMYLESLRKLVIPDDVEVTILFCLHNSEHLKKYLNKQEKYYVLNDEVKYEKEDRTHIWTDDNFKTVIKIKNALLNFAYNQGFDYIFLVDSDLILHPNTLVSLYNADKDIIAEIFWTLWDKSNLEMKPMPNAWRYDSYSMDPKEVEQWKQKGIYRVGMTGACTLIKRKVLEKNVNFTPINNVSFTAWEDRAFCIRAAVNGFEIWLDTNYPATHLYRREEVEEYKKSLRPKHTKPFMPSEVK